MYPVSRDDLQVPTPLRVAAAIGWRVLVVAAAVAVVAVVTARLAGVVVPLAIALLLAALLAPAVRGLHERGAPRALAVTVVMLAALALLGGIITFVVVALAQGVPALGTQLTASIDAVVTWLTDGPLHLGAEQLRALQDSALATLEAQRGAITESAIATTASLGVLLAEILLAVFALVLFLQGGGDIWQFLLHAVPSPVRVRVRVDVAGRRSLAALAAYVRATAIVAVVDAVAIGVALALLGIPLAGPLAALVFLGAFVPIVGAVLAGGVAVLIALVSAGPGSALVVLAVIVAVMQLEGHVLQPLLLGRAVRLHPLAVAVAISAGLILAGIVGALLAVPLLATVNSAVRSLRSAADEHVDPDDITTSEPAESGPDDPTLTREPALSPPGTDRQGQGV